MSHELDTLLMQAFQARREHRPDDARRDLVQAVDLARTAGVPVQLARALTGLGQLERDLRRSDSALELYREAASIYRQAGDALKLAHTVRHVGDIHQDQGRPDLAEPCYHEALGIYRGHEHTPPLDLANAIRSLAVLKDQAGAREEARLLWQEAGGLYASCNVKEGVAESSRRLASAV